MKKIYALLTIMLILNFACISFATNIEVKEDVPSTNREIRQTLLSQIRTTRSSIEKYQLIEHDLEGISLYSEVISEMNDSLKEMHVEDILSTFTFSEYLDFSGLIEYASEHSINVEQIQLRAISESGQILTIFAKTYLGLDETAKLIYRQASSAEEQYTIIGIIALNGYIDSDNLDTASSDSRTYLIDTSGDIIFQNTTLGESDELSLSKERDNSKSEFPHSLAWDLEALGILNSSQLP